MQVKPWSYSDEAFMRSVRIVLEAEPIPDPPDWDTDDGLGCITGVFRLLCIELAAAAVVVAIYLLVR
jgi:hypothetical protein